MDHVTEALSRLMSQYSGADRIRGVVSALATQSQDEENTLQDILVKEIFQTAVGEQLDGWGAILDVPRGAFSDADYRARLAVKVAQINSEGTIPDLINIFKQMTNSWKTQLVEHFPATFSLHAYSAPVVPEANIDLITSWTAVVAKVTVKNSDGWGKVTRSTLSTDLSVHKILSVKINRLLSSTVVVGITDATDANNPVFYRLNPVSISTTGTHQFNVPALTGMSGVRVLYPTLIVEALLNYAAEFDEVFMANEALDDFSFKDDFNSATPGAKPAGWFDARGGIATLYDFGPIREAIEVSKCAGVEIDSLTYDTELPAFAFAEFSMGDYPVAGFDDGTGTVGGTLASGF